MITFNYLMAQALIVLNAKLKKENTAKRVGSLFRDILLFIQNMVLGIILKGEKTDEAAIKSIQNPQKGDTYKAIDTGHYWTYDGTAWNDIGEIIPNNPALNSFSFVDDSVNLERTVDNNNTLLSRIDNKGKTKLPTQSIPDLVRDTRDNYVVRDSEGKKVISIDKKGYLASALHNFPTKIRDNDNIYKLTDSEGKVLLRINKKGVVIPSLLELPENTLEQIKGSLKNNDFSDYKSLQIPFPTTLGRVDITGSLVGISKEDSVRVTLEYNNYSGVYFKKLADLSYQGSSSMAFEKKNYAIDLLNEDESSFELRVGNWVAQDSFHFKANYIDATQSLNVVCCRLYEQMRETKIYGERKPWQSMTDETYGSANSDIKYRFDNGALGHIDGFPIEIYINGNYQGLFTWNLKKHRKNYMMDKSNPLHIHWELSSHDIMGTQPIPWNAIEIRNPKGFTANAEPTDGTVKTAFMRQWNWSNGLTDSVFLSQYQNYVNLDFWVDWMLFIEFVRAEDCKEKNTQWTMYDAKIVVPLPYDLDTTFGGSDIGNKIAWKPDEDFIFRQPIDLMIKKHFPDKLKDRYKELRDKGIFTLENVVNLFENFMKQIGEDAFKRDFERWVNTPSNSPTFRASLGQKRDWTAKRIVFLDNKYNYQS